jgi:hypothetical protein
MTTPLPYNLYGLAGGNPYAQKPLNPLETPTDGDQLLDLDGFIRREEVVTYLQEKADSGQPAFVLVGGRNHTGRTSMANWILYNYFELREVKDRFLHVCVPVKDQATFPWLMKAIAQLRAKLKRISDLTLNKEISDAIKECLNVKADMPYEELFQEALGDLSVELRSRKYALGVVFEGIPDAKFIAAAKTVFESSEAVVVYTYDDYEHPQTTGAKGFRAVQFDDVLHVYLEPLASRQVGILAKDRWDVASSNLEFPFEDGVLEDLYRDNRTPIRKVLKRLEDFVDYKLEMAPPGAAAWPGNRKLFMKRQWLSPTFKFLDRSS